MERDGLGKHEKSIGVNQILRQNDRLKLKLKIKTEV